MSLAISSRYCLRGWRLWMRGLRLADRGPDPKPGLSSAPVCAGRCHGRRGAAAGVIR